MAYTPPNINGQATSANSAPVTIASDQSIIPVRTTTGYAPVTGTITASGQTVVLSSAIGVGSVTIAISGTYAGIALAFEAYDGTNWQSVLGRLTATVNPTPSTLTGTITANSTTSYEVPLLLGFSQFRVRATSYTSGTMSLTVMPSSQYAGSTSYVSGSVSVSNNVSLAASTNTIGGAFIQPNTNSTTLTTFNTTAQSSTTVLVKTGTTRLHEIIVDNPNTAKVYLQCFNAAAAANVTLGTTTPTAFYPVPTSGIFEDAFLISRNYALGLVIAVTTTPNGSTAPTTAVPVNLGYL